jgi:hypothetical protein
VEASSDEELRSLVQSVRPLYPGINAYLDQTGDAERAVPYGDLAQAAMEAQFEVDRRYGTCWPDGRTCRRRTLPPCV